MGTHTAITATMSVLVLGATANAAVLTFDVGASPGDAIADSYGDRISTLTDGVFSYGAAGGFTPNVVVDLYGLDTGDAMKFWDSGYSELENVAFNRGSNPNGFAIALAADAGFQVGIDSLDLGNFSSSIITVPEIRVEDGFGNLLASMTDVVVGGNVSPSLNIFFEDDVEADELLITFDTTGISTNMLGVDNVQFYQLQSVPAPAALALLGLAGLAPRRRRD